MLSLIRVLIIFTSLFMWSFYQNGYSQSSDEISRKLIILEKEYNDLLKSALQMQVKADSLVRISNLKRSEINSASDENAKARLGKEVIALEKQAFEIQAETNGKYTAARELEMRLLALKRAVPESSASSDPSPRIKPVDAKKDEILLLSFLYGRPDIEPYIGPSSLSKLKSIEGKAYQVNKVFNDVSEINQEIENLKMLIDSNPRSRKNRTHRKEIDDLQKRATLKNLEALAAIEEINRVKLEVLRDVVNAAKVSVTSRELIQKASVHEGASEEHVREAVESRKVAVELRTEKFSHDYMMRAHQKELLAMDELYKAFDLFTGKPSVTPAAIVERPAVAVVANQVPAIKKVDTEVKPDKESSLLAEEVKKVKDTTKEEKPENRIPLNISLPAGLAYRIQVGIYQNDVPLPNFGDLPNLSGESEEGNGTTRYFSGMYVRFGEAERALLDVRRLGFRDAFIVSYLDGRRIPVNRAVSMEREREERPAVVVAQITVPETSAVVRETPKIAEQTGDLIVFKVQIGVFRNLITQENRDRFMKLAGNQRLDYTLNNNGLYVYTIGIFNTFEEAVLTRDKLVSGGINDAFVVVFKNGEKVPLSQVIK